MRMIDADNVLERIENVAQHWQKQGKKYEAMLVPSVMKSIIDSEPTLTPSNEWISVSDKLPEEKEYVLIAMHDVIEVARIEKGISQEERRKMKSGEIPDAEEFGYEPGKPPFVVKRSDAIKAADQEGNNLVPYIWRARSGPMDWFGQYVTHWMPLAKPPKGTEDVAENATTTEHSAWHEWIKERFDAVR